MGSAIASRSVRGWSAAVQGLDSRWFETTEHDLDSAVGQVAAADDCLEDLIGVECLVDAGNFRSVECNGPCLLYTSDAADE